MPIVSNDDLEQALDEIVLLVMARLKSAFKVEPRAAFGLPPARRDRTDDKDRRKAS